MRSPLEAIDGDYTHAIFTTYSVSLSFFEKWVLPLLTHSGVRNVVVFADAGLVGEALLDSGAQRVGTFYHVVPTSFGSGVFHPKLMLLTGEGGQRLVVSSANLTVSGQLRNLEAAVVLDSSRGDHRPAIAQAGEFIRRLAAASPHHVVEAVMAALESIESDTAGSATVEFLHNLDAPMAHRLPEGDITATVPFADADGRALETVSEDRRVQCIVDGENFEAGARFFEIAKDLDVRRFTRARALHVKASTEPPPRALHAKAYWNDRRALIGSPNLSVPGLLRTADSGNVEAAVLLTTDEAMTDPGGVLWAGDLRESAVARSRAASREKASSLRPKAFRAWEEEGVISADGLPDATPVERFTGLGWEPYGVVDGGKIVPTDETHRPRLLRAEIGTVTYVAAVHRVHQLRISRAQRMSSRSSEVVHSLPLELPDVRLLEEILGELFTLGSLTEEEQRSAELRATRRSDDDETSTLSEWRPAHPTDEPRIPEVYRRSWSKDPEGLLTLVRAALRIEKMDADTELSDFDLLLEGRDIDEMWDTDEESRDDHEEAAIPVATEAVLTRYRRSFRKLLDRGVRFMAKERGTALGDLVFQTLMEQSERLLITVEVDGRIEYLVDPADLLRFRLNVLKAYLGEDSRIDPLCAATARYHLADLIRNPSSWSPLEWETIENLAYRHAGPLGEIAAGPTGNTQFLGATGAGVDAWLDDYVARADWLGVAEHAEQLLAAVDVVLDPYPAVFGTGVVDPSRASPAWECLGYGVVAGTADEDPYGVAVLGEGDTSFETHLLVFDPASDTLYEAMRRRVDGAWLARSYLPVGRGDLERTGRLGPSVLRNADRSSLTEQQAEDLPELLRPLVRKVSTLMIGGDV